MTDLALKTKQQLVAFYVGEQEFCVNITAVKEIRQWSPVVPIPHAPHHVPGVINLRGTVLPVVDLGKRLGIPVDGPTERHVIVIVWIGKQLVGLLVDGVCDILSVDQEAFQATPNVGGATTDALISALVHEGNRLLSFIALEQLLQQDKAETA